MIEKNTNPAERSASWAPMSLAAVLIFVLLFVAGAAHAGIPRISQTHPFKVSGTIFIQGVNEKTGDDILDMEKFSEKDFAANCLMQEKLEKGQAVVLVLNDACEDLNDNELQVIIQEPPFSVEIGQIHFDDERQILSEKNGVDNTLTMSAAVELDCIGTDIVDVLATAIATIKLSDEGLCRSVESIKLKNASGTGLVDDIDVILDGVKAAAKKPLN